MIERKHYKRLTYESAGSFILSAADADALIAQEDCVDLLPSVRDEYMTPVEYAALPEFPMNGPAPVPRARHNTGGELSR